MFKQIFKMSILYPCYLRYNTLVNPLKKDIRIKSFGMHRLKMISKLLDKGFLKSEIIKELNKKLFFSSVNRRISISGLL